MKKIAYLFSATAMIALATLSSCKKDDEPTVDNNPDAPVVTSTMTTTNGGNSGTAISSIEVTTSTGSAKLRLDVTSAVDLDRIYIMKSEDNGSLSPVSTSDIVTSSYGTFTGSSADYTLKVPGSTKAFVVDIPVSVRSSSSAVTDVYYIWITNGTGSFLKPTKNVTLGPATLTLKYTAATVIPYSSATLNVGTQSALYSSFLVTSGQVSALSTSDYTDAPGSADIRFVSLDGSGKKNNTATNIYMYSPNDVTAANPPSDASAAFSVATGSRTTYFASYSGTAFESATGSDLNFADLTSGNNIQITSGSTYKFQTATGKKGLIKINSLTADTDATNAGGYNANVSIKVLN